MGGLVAFARAGLVRVLGLGELFDAAETLGHTIAPRTERLAILTNGGGVGIIATDLLIDAADGLRVINEVEQLAALEYAACQTSDGVRRLLTGLVPGMTEREAVRLLAWNGMPPGSPWCAWRTAAASRPTS